MSKSKRYLKLQLSRRARQNRVAGGGRECPYCCIRTDRISWIEPPDRPHYDYWDQCTKCNRLFMHDEYTGKATRSQVPKEFQFDSWEQAEATFAEE